MALATVGAMATVLILHSALGRRPAIGALAATIASLGHDVVAPDLFDGQVFDGGEAGYAAAMAHLKDQGAAADTRVAEAYAALTGPVVVIGFSWGAGHAQQLAEREAGVVGAMLVAGGGRYSGEWDDGGRWRRGIPLALHHMVDDEWDDAEPAAALVREAATNGADVSDYVYPGSAHLFMDDGLPEEYDRECAELFAARVQGFLSRFA